MRVKDVRRRAVHVLTAVAVVLGLTVLFAAPAQAELCEVTDSQGKVTYVECAPGGGTTTPPPGGGGGSGGGPSCDLSKEPYTEFCHGNAACWGNNPSPNTEDDLGDRIGPKPGDDYHIAFRSCDDGEDKWYWTKDDAPSREELARRAYGALQVPDFTPTFNPPTRTYVNLDTWWWAQGAGTDELVGSAANGIRALATPDHMEVDPGDGSGVFRCEFSTAKSDECAHTYRRASYAGKAVAADGSKAYPARMRLVWDVRFEDDGAPLVIGGLPTSLASPWQGAPVPVREIQTVVVPRR